jgi:hypothetical protein
MKWVWIIGPAWLLLALPAALLIGRSIGIANRKSSGREPAPDGDHRPDANRAVRAVPSTLTPETGRSPSDPEARIPPPRASAAPNRDRPPRRTARLSVVGSRTRSPDARDPARRK